MTRSIVTGSWKRVEFEWVTSAFAPTQADEDRIEQAWARAAGRPGVNLFDGPMCRLESFSSTDQLLSIRVSRTTYRRFVGTNLAGHFEANRAANPLGMSCALISADNHLLLGRRNARVAYYPGRVHPFAGALEPADPMDLFEQMRRELAEELSLEPADLSDFSCLGLIEDPAIRQPELVVMATARFSADELLQRVDRAEHSEAIAVALRAEDIERYLGDPDLTPVAAGVIMLVQHHFFGPPVL